MNHSLRAGLTPFKTQRFHRGLPRNLQSRHGSDETRKTLEVMVNAPTSLRAYILADAALVRGELTLRQRAQVDRAETELKGCGERRSGQDKAGERCGARESQPARTHNLGATVLSAETRLGLTQAAVLRRGKRHSGYSWALLESGFSRKQITEIIGSIALRTFSHYFTDAKTFETIA